MFIKLNFNSNTNLYRAFRYVDDIINTSSITSISAFETRINSSTYAAGLRDRIDYANSEIIRTNDTTLVKSHLNSEGASQYDAGRFTLEFDVNDNPGEKYYVQYQCSGSTNAIYTRQFIGDSLSGGTITSSSLSPSAHLTNDHGNTANLIVGNYYNNGGYIVDSGQATVRSLWMYITNNGMIWCTTNTDYFNSGFGVTYTNETKFNGPFIVSQYTRYDSWNTHENGIIPVFYSNPKNGIGTFEYADFTSSPNPTYSTNAVSHPVRVYRTIDVYPKVGSAWPIISDPNVSFGAGHHRNEVGNLTQVPSGPNTAAASVTQSGPISAIANTRHPNSTLTNAGFSLLPLRWSQAVYGNVGGNVSEKGGFYFFNGDYSPGDIFAFNNKVWMIWPMYFGYTDRIGFAIPKE